MSDVVIHGFPQSSYVRTARMTLEEKGVAYEVQPIEPGSDAHRDLHPFMKMPSMDHGDVHVYETSAICRYVDEAFDGPSLQPGDPAARACMNQWISSINDYFYPPMIREFVLQRIVAPMRGNEPDEERIAAAMPDIRRAIDVTDGALADSRFLAGEDLSIADLFLAPIFFYVGISPEGPELFAGKNNIAGWKARIGELQSFQTTMPPKPEAAE